MSLFFLDQHQVLVSGTAYVLNICCLRYREHQQNSQRNRTPDSWQPLSPRYTCRFYVVHIPPYLLRSLRFSSNGVRTFPVDNTVVIRLQKFYKLWNKITGIFCLSMAQIICRIQYNTTPYRKYKL